MSIIFTYFMPVYTSYPLVNVAQAIPGIVIDLRYATSNNFTGQIVYTKAVCAVHEDLIEALKEVLQELQPYGFGLKIFDGYRPQAAQWRFWELVPDERYVSNPKKGGRHTRGTAVDLTMIYLATGEEVPMPTEFDNFTERAWHGNHDATEEQIYHRELLRTVMTKHGFEVLKTEWWHYDFKGWQDYAVLDIPLEDID